MFHMFHVFAKGSFRDFSTPRPSTYPLLRPKYPLLGGIQPQFRVLGGFSCSYIYIHTQASPGVLAGAEIPTG